MPLVLGITVIHVNSTAPFSLWNDFPFFTYCYHNKTLILVERRKPKQLKKCKTVNGSSRLLLGEDTRLWGTISLAVLLLINGRFFCRSFCRSMRMCWTVADKEISLWIRCTTEGFTNETSPGKSPQWNKLPKPASDSNSNLVALPRNILVVCC